MKLPFLPCPSCPKSHFPHQLALANALLFGFLPLVAQAQSLTFAGAVTKLPTDDLYLPLGIVLDNAGDLIIEDTQNYRVVELPRTATGFGPQMTLPLGNLNFPELIAIDGAGDLFISNYGDNLVLEFPKTPTGYGPRTIVYDGGPYTGQLVIGQIVADSNGNLFIGEGNPQYQSVQPPPLVEVPRTATGYGNPVSYDISLYSRPTGLAVDSAGNIFIADYKDAGSGEGGRVKELPKTATGYGAPKTLFDKAPFGISYLTIDGSGNLFGLTSRTGAVAEFPHTSTGLGKPIMLPYFTDYNRVNGLAADSGGNLYANVQPGGGLYNLPYLAVEMQFNAVDFGSANICPPAATHPAPCSQKPILYYSVNASQTVGTPTILTGGAPNLDFNLEEPSNCTGNDKIGTFCQVKVAFRPLDQGTRNGEVEMVDSGGNVLATTPLHGTGVAIGDTAQTIDFTPLSAQTAGTNVALTASASSGLPVTFTSSTQLICTIDGSTVVPLTSGTCEVKAIQPGNAEYYPASKRQSFFVHHARQTIDFPPIASQVVGNSFTVEGTASSGLGVYFTSLTERVCLVYNGVVFTADMLSEGTCTIQAEQGGNGEYYSVITDQSFHVSSAQ